MFSKIFKAFNKINIPVNDINKAVTAFRIIIFSVIMLMVFLLMLLTFIKFKNHARYISLTYRKGKNNVQKK